MAFRKIPPQEYLRECFDYDPQTGITVWRARPIHHFQNESYQKRFLTRCAGKQCGALSDEGRRYVSLCGVRYPLTRVLWKLMTGEEPETVDHINGDPADDRFKNLRAATHIQNCFNRLGPKTRKLPKGVRFCKNGWESAIDAYGVTHYLGRFKSQKDAEAAYKEAAERLHGEFARTGSH